LLVIKILFWNDNDILSPLLLSKTKAHALGLKRSFEGEGEKFDKMLISTLGEEGKIYTL